MKIEDLENIWQAYDEKLEQSLQLNIKVLEKIEGRKVHQSFNALVRFKVFTVVFGILWNAFLLFLLYYTWREPFFAVAMVFLIIINTYAMVEYVKQVTMIREIDFGDSISSTQMKLTQLHVSVIRTYRVIFLQLPLWTIFYIKADMITYAGGLFWAIQSAITLLSIFGAIWLYRNISVKNAGSRWVKALIHKDGGKSIEQATRFIKEIDEFKKDIVS